MNGNYTFAIIKPNAVRTGKTGPILSIINEAAFEIVAMKMTRMSLKQAEDFYGIHKGKPFFDTLVEFMSSGPVFVLILNTDI